MADESTGNPQGGKADRPLPNCKALLLCSKVIVDDFTKEPSLIGIMNRLELAEIPGTSVPFVAFLQLADGIGEYNLTIEVHDLQEDAIVAQGEIGKVIFRRRPIQLNRVIPIPGLRLEHDGNYVVVVLLNGRELERQQFTVHLKRNRGE